MPVYDFKCNKCGYFLTVSISMNRLDEVTNKLCPECKQGYLKQFYGNSKVGVVWKGGKPSGYNMPKENFGPPKFVDKKTAGQKRGKTR